MKPILRKPRQKKKQINSQQENATLIGLNGRKNVYVPDNAKHIFIAGTTGSGKTVALSNYILHGIQENYPLLIIDGKGDIGEGSILEITKRFCRSTKRSCMLSISLTLQVPVHITLSKMLLRQPARIC